MAENFELEGAHYDRLTRAAEHHGAEKQVCKLVEECGELLGEIGRAMNGAENKVELIEEVADVYNMLDQICYLFGIEEAVQVEAEKKMIREMERIG